MALWESDSSKPIMECNKAMKRQQCSGIASVAPQAWTIPTCKIAAEILFSFQFLLIIIIIIKYINIIYYDCTGFPQPMVVHTFNN